MYHYMISIRSAADQSDILWLWIVTYIYYEYRLTAKIIYSIKEVCYEMSITVWNSDYIYTRVQYFSQ